MPLIKVVEWNGDDDDDDDPARREVVSPLSSYIEKVKSKHNEMSTDITKDWSGVRR